MDMYALEKLEKVICKELESISNAVSEKNEISVSALEKAHNLTDTLKNIYKIHVLKEDMEGGYSGRRYSGAGMWEADMRGTYGHGRSYNEGGNSYGMRHMEDDGYSGRRHLVRAHYSRSGDAKEEMMENLQDMYENAPSDKTREAIRKCMDSMRNI